MNDAARRAVPHITHTPALEDAAIAVTNAKDGRDLHVKLCGNPLDVASVRAALTEVGGWFVDPSYFFEGPAAEQAAATNLALLATLLAEHLKAGNT